MKRSSKTILKILNVLLIGMAAIVLLSNIYTLAARKITGEANPTFLGFTSAIVLTGSMEPAILPNDMVFVHRQADYKENDIVMYRGDTSTVTHRIVKIGENGGYITQGDANNTDDGEIPKERIIGKVFLIIPGIGAALSFFQTPVGLLILLAILFIIIELPNLIKKQKQ